MHMPLLRRRPAAALLPAALLVVLATACGDSDPAASPPTDQDESPTASDPGAAPSADPTASPTDDATTGPAPSASLPGGAGIPADGDADLVLRVTDAGGTVTEHTLSCEPDGAAAGDHPDPAAACADLYAALETGDPFQPVPPDVMCTEQYGGPETAEVTGTVGDAEVSASFSLTDGCEISRWEAMGAVLAPFGGTT